GGQPHEGMWIQNAALIWVPIMIVLTVGAWLLMNNLPQHKCGPTPIAIGKYLWLQALGFAGTGVGVLLLLFVKPRAVPELIWIFIVLVASVISTLLLMRFCTPADTKQKLQAQFAIFSNKHNWIMTWLYTMTFGSFIGYSNAFP